MQDGKALQAGTSHHLGQNFAKAFDLKFQTEAGDWQHAFNTSWGVSTRLVGAIVMAHGDDNGLVLPPQLAPIQVVIVPIFKGSDPVEKILAAARGRRSDAQEGRRRGQARRPRQPLPGFKFNEWELAGVPLRIELGPKDLEKGSVCCVKRLNRAKSFVPVGRRRRGRPQASRRAPGRDARGRAGRDATRRRSRSTATTRSRRKLEIDRRLHARALVRRHGAARPRSTRRPRRPFA